MPMNLIVTAFLNGCLNGCDYLDVYQLKVFGKARVLGFLYNAVFFLVIYDISHEAYKRQDRGKGNGHKGIKGRRRQ
ncbi:MAG TPA: hypothetical protein DCS83_04735 [Prevotella sp.]|nr:hypothetical protein [Prevotella sp.]